MTSLIDQTCRDFDHLCANLTANRIIDLTPGGFSPQAQRHDALGYLFRAIKKQNVPGRWFSDAGIKAPKNCPDGSFVNRFGLDRCLEPFTAHPCQQGFFRLRYQRVLHKVQSITSCSASGEYSRWRETR